MRYRELVALGLAFFLTTAQTSSADAVFWQAFDLETGANGTKDIPGATRLYQQGARQGHGPFMVRLGYMKQLGTGMPQDLRGAFALYKQSAETGTLEGQFMYALSYEQGSAPRRTR
jgi:TPR repeat protein